MEVIDAGLMPYRSAWALQEQLHAHVVAGESAKLVLVEHPPVITLGRRPGVEQNLRVDPAALPTQGIELIQTDRGGDITYHGPGQLVCYPIVRLTDANLSIGSYVHGLERAIIDVLSHWNITAHADPSAVGVWCDEPIPAKICAIGVRVRHGVTLHGLALNITTDLTAFNLIVPCGLAGRPVTSMQKLLGDKCPAMDAVKTKVTIGLQTWLERGG